MLDEQRTAAGVLPTKYVSGITEIKGGAWPCGLFAEYPPDTEEMSRYARAARSEEGFRNYLRDVRNVA